MSLFHAEALLLEGERVTLHVLHACDPFPTEAPTGTVGRIGIYLYEWVHPEKYDLRIPVTAFTAVTCGGEEASLLTTCATTTETARLTR
ncbi:hypothetical protein ABRP69_10180 [Corynebacterium sp. KPL3806]